MTENTATKSAAKASQTTPQTEPFDASWFARDHRIHIEDGSQYLSGFLMVHPGELKPENQLRLTGKLIQHFSASRPGFMEFYPRNVVALSLASYLPISKEARLESIKEQTQKLETFVNEGIHPDGKEQIWRYQEPLEANIKMRRGKPTLDPTVREYLDSAITAYLVINEALRTNNRLDEAATYVSHIRSPDTVMADLASKLGVPMSELIETTQTKGIDGLAERLGVKQGTVAEIREVVALAGEQGYIGHSNNVIVNWDLGRHQPGMDERSIEEKITVGTRVQAMAALNELATRQRLQALPPDVQETENLLVPLFRELPEPLQKVMYYSGLEFGFVNGSSLGPLNQGLEHVAGVNTAVPEQGGLKTILIANLDSWRQCRNTFHHEANHCIYPDVLGDEGITALQSAIENNGKRLEALKKELLEWKMADKDEAKRAAIAKRIDEQFRVGEIGLHQALAKDSANPVSMDTLHDWVDTALSNLSQDSHRLTKGYPLPELRVEEAVSRFAALHYVELKDQPALLGFIAPELMVAYHDIVVPHYEKKAQQLEAEQSKLPEPLRYLGLSADIVLPQTQQQTMPHAERTMAVSAPTADSQTPEPSIISRTIKAVNRLNPLQQSHTTNLTAGT